MYTVTLSAYRGLGVSSRDCAPVDALLIRQEGPGTQAARLQDKLLAMARSTGVGDVSVVHLRVGIAGRENGVGVAVTAHAAGRSGVARLDSCGMKASIVGGVCICVAVAAVDRGGSRVMRDSLHVRVTISAVETVMNGAAEPLFVDVICLFDGSCTG